MKDGGAAFPILGSDRTCVGSIITAHVEKGMSLRDWFAGQALVGYCTHGCISSMRQTAGWCYEFADAMLEAREEQEGK